MIYNYAGYHASYSHEKCFPSWWDFDKTSWNLAEVFLISWSCRDSAKLESLGNGKDHRMSFSSLEWINDNEDEFRVSRENEFQSRDPMTENACSSRDVRTYEIRRINQWISDYQTILQDTECDEKEKDLCKDNMFVFDSKMTRFGCRFDLINHTKTPTHLWLE